MKIAVQIGHWPVEGGAAHEVETLKYIYPHVVGRLRSAGFEVGEFNGSLINEPGNYQHQYDGAVFLHCDAGSPTSTGFSIGFWSEKHPGSRALAATLKKVYGKATGLRFIGYNITVGEHHYYGNRRFCHQCKCTLLECGFVSNPTERAYLQANGKKLGYAIADAYIQYFGGSIPIPGEEDRMIGYVVDFKEVKPNDGYKHVYVAAEGWYDIGWVKGKCSLLIKNESDEIAVVKVFTTPGSGDPSKMISLPPRSDEQSRGYYDMAEFAPTGGYATILKSNTEITGQISIIAEKV